MFRCFHAKLKRQTVVNASDAAELFGTGESASTPINVDAAAKMSELEEMEDLDAEKMLEVNSAIAVEKEIAADTIGTIFENTKQHFLPYVEQAAMELVGLLPHYYEGIRKSSTQALLEVVRTFYKLSEPEQWQQGLHSLQNSKPIHKNVKDLINHALPALLDMYETEDDK